ncbi:MAG: methylmalonyl Co-A mutase-associated GTPase MeaB [bacterium]
MELAERVLEGDIRAAARLMRLLDDEMEEGRRELKKLYKNTGKAFIIGITGPPGAGKSTLVDQLIAHFRKDGKKVGVIAVDPSSPFTGGAILGDRIRMQRHSNDPEVFIRSLASRGHLGGLTASTEEISLVMDAMGKDIVLLETVGVGQDEVEVVDLAHTSILVTVPGLGDDVQAIKAGVMEIGNIFVVNKADREGADRAYREIVGMLDMVNWESRFRPPVLMVEANSGKGIKELVQKIYEHKQFLEKTGSFQNFFAKRAKKMFEKVLLDEVSKALVTRIKGDRMWSEWEEKLTAREVDPYTLAREVMEEFVCIKQ